ncbi:MAG: hypothetical protein E7562_07415 [Ruminococcaceae bacterium]|nr:hypothetical protein [Oscillospiraceae bacterium]
MSRLTKRNYISAIINAILISIIFLFHYTNLFSITIYNVSPMLLLPFFVGFAIYSEEMPATFVGAIIGFFADSTSSSGSYFHTFYFFILGLAISLMMHYLLNNNIRSAIMLSLVSSILYFVLRWLFFHAFSGSDNSIEYLMQYALPSVIYTSVFIFPFYYLQRFIFRFKVKGRV